MIKAIGFVCSLLFTQYTILISNINTWQEYIAPASFGNFNEIDFSYFSACIVHIIIKSLQLTFKRCITSANFDWVHGKSKQKEKKLLNWKISKVNINNIVLFTLLWMIKFNWKLLKAFSHFHTCILIHIYLYCIFMHIW